MPGPWWPFDCVYDACLCFSANNEAVSNKCEYFEFALGNCPMPFVSDSLDYWGLYCIVQHFDFTLIKTHILGVEPCTTARNMVTKTIDCCHVVIQHKDFILSTTSPKSTKVSLEIHIFKSPAQWPLDK